LVATTRADNVTQGAGPSVGSHRWLALGFLLLAVLLDLLDTTIVNVAIPSIHGDLGLSYSAVQWIVAGYLLMFAIVLLTSGRLGDIVGRKRMVLIGIAGFTVASAVCGLANSSGVLVGARIAQGAMAAVVLPQMLAVVRVNFTPEERPKAFGLYSGIGALAAAIGPLVGGLIIKLNLFDSEWRPIFLINVPIGLISFVGTMVYLRDSRAPTVRRLDLVGAVLAALAMWALMYPLVQGRASGWPVWAWVSLIAFIPLLGLFVLWERRREEPMIDLALFRLRSFGAGLSVALLFFSGVGAFFLMFVLYLQVGLQFSALHSGLTTLPFAVGTGMAAGIAAKMTATRGRQVMASGSIAAVLGLMGIILTIHYTGTGITSWWLIPSMLVMGAGMGLTLVPLTDMVLAEVPRGDAGSGAGTLSTIQQLGTALGAALIGIVFFDRLGSSEIANAGGPGGAELFTRSFQFSLWWVAGAFALSLVPVMVLPAKAPHRDVLSD
jgi:EmrB/QacA subfamily drug resistance transporter